MHYGHPDVLYDPKLLQLLNLLLACLRPHPRLAHPPLTAQLKITSALTTLTTLNTLDARLGAYCRRVARVEGVELTHTCSHYRTSCLCDDCYDGCYDGGAQMSEWERQSAIVVKVW